jgi:hypothetical protein
MTALAGLALLADGNLPSSGHHAVAVRRAVDYLLAASDPVTGLIGGQEMGRPMFGHGYAMLFLAQVYGSEGDADLRKRIRETLQKAVELSVKAQNPWGGWYYTPTTENDEGAVTITQIQGLRACADAGIAVPPKSIDGAIGYIKKSVNPDGGIAYRASAPGESRPAITCAALAVLYSAGQYESELVKKALAYAMDNVPMTGVTARGGGHFFYAHLYLSQVMYIRGGEEWKQYFEPIRNWLLTAQNPDGSWEGDYIGPTYGTAIALLILQLPYGTLPVAQR